VTLGALHDLPPSVRIIHHKIANNRINSIPRRTSLQTLENPCKRQMSFCNQGVAGSTPVTGSYYEAGFGHFG
jgi:hypothetical protein